MKYAVDKIENDIAVLENIETGSIIEVDLDKLPKQIKEKDIIKFENNKYVFDIKEKEKIIEQIEEKMKLLKK